MLNLRSSSKALLMSRRTFFLVSSANLVNPFRSSQIHTSAMLCPTPMFHIVHMFRKAPLNLFGIENTPCKSVFAEVIPHYAYNNNEIPSEAHPSTIITLYIKQSKKLHISNEVLGEINVSVESLVRDSASGQGMLSAFHYKILYTHL